MRKKVEEKYAGGDLCRDGTRKFNASAMCILRDHACICTVHGFKISEAITIKILGVAAVKYRQSRGTVSSAM